MKDTCDWRDRGLSLGLLTLRLLVGLAMAKHGYDKLFGGQITMLIGGLEKMGFPAPTLMGWLATLAEFLGGLFMALGLGTRIASLFVLIDMLVAFFVAHRHDPWMVKELAYMYASVSLSLVLAGGGCYALESLFCRHNCGDAKAPVAH